MPSPSSPACRILGSYCLHSIAACASDSSTLLRKAAASTLNELYVAEPSVAMLQSLWLQCVLPQALDGDAQCVAKAVECVSNAVVNRVIEWHGHALALRKSSPTALSHAHFMETASVWHLLSATSGHPDLTRSLEVALAAMFKSVAMVSGSASDVSKSAAAAAITSVADFDALVKILCFAAEPGIVGLLEERGGAAAGTIDPQLSVQLRNGAWMLLEQLTSCLCGSPMAEHHPAGDDAVAGGKAAGASLQAGRRRALATMLMPVVEAAWEALLPELRGRPPQESESAAETGVLDSALADTDGPSRDAARMLRIVCMLAPSMPSASASFAAKLRASLLLHLCAFAWDAALVTEGVKVLAAMSAPEGAVPWATSLLAACEAALTRYLRSADAEAMARQAHIVITALFSVGAVALAAMKDGDDKDGEGSASGSSGALPLPSHAHVVTLVEALLAPTMLAWHEHLSEASGPVRLSATLPIAVDVRAHAYLALGKLCLRDRGLAKRYVAVFVRDIQVGVWRCRVTYALCMTNASVWLQSRSSTPAAVRNNILFVLGDLCVRFTALVDRYIPVIAGSIADPSPLVSLVILPALDGTLVFTPMSCGGRCAVTQSSSSPNSCSKTTSSSAGRSSIALSALSPTPTQTCASAPSRPSSLRLDRSPAASSTPSLLRLCSSSPAARASLRLHICSSNSRVPRRERAEHLRSLLLTLTPRVLQRCRCERKRNKGLHPCSPFSRLTCTFGLLSQVRSPALRRQVYATLLAAMPDELRLTVYSKLASDVLGAVAEGTIALSVAGSAAGPAELGTTELLLTEVLQLLSMPPLRVQTKRGAAGAASAAADDDDEADANGGAEGATALQASIAAAKSRLVAKLMKRQIAEQVLPVVLGLRQVLQVARSPVMGALLGYVKTLFDDYGEEISGTCLPCRVREQAL